MLVCDKKYSCTCELFALQINPPRADRMAVMWNVFFGFMGMAVPWMASSCELIIFDINNKCDMTRLFWILIHTYQSDVYDVWCHCWWDVKSGLYWNGCKPLSEIVMKMLTIFDDISTGLKLLKYCFKCNLEPVNDSSSCLLQIYIDWFASNFVSLKCFMHCN